MGQGIDDFAKRMAEPPPEETPKIGRRSVLGRVALLFGGVGAGVLATDTPSFAATTTTCPPGLKKCGQKCRVITIDPDNCGACGHKCGNNEICRGGLCKTLTADPTCGAGQTWCGACVDTASDPANCGTCGHACGSGKICTGGVCQTAAECVAASDCPGSDTECSTRTCINNTCGTSAAASGTLLAAQTTGDCKAMVCDGAGGTTQINDDTDTPAPVECFSSVCTQGNPTLVPSGPGTPCAGGTCDGAGVCVPN